MPSHTQFYSGPQARYYDQYFTGLEGEAEFYAALSDEVGAPVLELGCGSARTMLPIAASGLRIVGIDGSAPMLQLARRKIAAVRADLVNDAELASALCRNIALVCADMRCFHLRSRFRLVTLPYRTFQHLLTDADRDRALGCIHQHLEPEGVLALNVFDPGPDVEDAGSSPSELEPDAVFADPETGARVEVWYRRRYDLEARHLVQEILYRSATEEGADAVEERTTLTLRYADPLETEELLESSGFRVQALCGSFAGEPFEGAGEQIWIAHKA